MSTIDTILELLGDGLWHELSEITEKSQLETFKVELVTSFLAEYSFVVLNKEQRKTKLTPTLYRFLNNIQRIEEKEAN